MRKYNNRIFFIKKTEGLDNIINFKSFIQVIWAGKWLITVFCSIAVVGAFSYVLNIQQWWVAKSVVFKPSFDNVTFLYQKSNRVQTMLNVYLDDENAVKKPQKIEDTQEFHLLSDPDILFGLFINKFNSSNSKRAFLKDNKTFLTYLKEKDTIKARSAWRVNVASVNNIYRHEMEYWMQGIVISIDNKTGKVSLYFRSNSQSSSTLLLGKYIEFIKKQVKLEQNNKFSLLLNTAKTSLLNIQHGIEKKMRKELEVLLIKTEYAYEIAKQANISIHQVNRASKDMLFPVDQGFNELEVNISLLKSIENIKGFEPTLINIKNKLDKLNAVTLNDDIEFSPFSYYSKYETPLNNAFLERFLIIGLSILLSMFFAIFILLAKYYFGVQKTSVKQLNMI